jgi:hypothetical protein
MAKRKRTNNDLQNITHKQLKPHQILQINKYEDFKPNKTFTTTTRSWYRINMVRFFEGRNDRRVI